MRIGENGKYKKHEIKKTCNSIVKSIFYTIRNRKRCSCKKDFYDAGQKFFG
jgi:hypothetical protein